MSTASPAFSGLRKLLTITAAIAVATVGLNAVSAQSASADEDENPVIQLFLADGTAYTDQEVHPGDVLTIRGSGFDVNANANQETIHPPIPANLPQGFYVVFGPFTSPWLPSADAPAENRKPVVTQRWMITDATYSGIPSNFLRAIDPQRGVLNADGTFEIELPLGDWQEPAVGANWGIYAYAAGGAINANEEIYLPLNFAPTPAGSNDGDGDSGDGGTGNAGNGDGGTGGDAGPVKTSTPSPTPEAPVCEANAIRNASMSWGVKSSFRDYVTGGIAQGSVTVNGVSASPAYGFSGGTGSYNSADNRGIVRFGGSVKFSGHEGVLQVTLSNLSLRIASANSGTLYANVSATNLSGDPFVANSVPLANVSFNRSVSGGVLSINSTAVKLTASGTHAFNDMYEVGTAMDALTLRAPLGATVDCDSYTLANLAYTGIDGQRLTIFGGVALALLVLGAAALVVARRRNSLARENA